MAAPHANADFIPGGYQIGSQRFGLTGGTFDAGAFKGTWNGTPIVVREPIAQLPDRGATVTLRYPTASLHFFDAQTERRIDAS